MQIDQLDDWRDKNCNLLESASEIRLSIVDVVLAASECSEDESEIFDLVDDFVASGRVELAPLNGDQPTSV